MVIFLVKVLMIYRVHFKFDFINIVDDNIIITSICLKSRACLKNAFCKMCVTICGRFRLNEGGVAGYVN